MALYKQTPTQIESSILHIAHIIDKNLTTSPERLAEIRNGSLRKLKRLLKDWSDVSREEKPTIEWAKKIASQLESGQIRSDIGCRLEPAKDIMGVIRGRRSVRTWMPKEIEPKTVDQLLEAVRWAPSSGNRQAVRVIILRTQKSKEAVVRLKEPFLCQAPLIMLVGVDARLYRKPERRGGLYLLDAAAAIQNMLLFGHSIGLGCCWSKLCVDDWEKHPRSYLKMKRELRLPAYFWPVSLVAIGWPAELTRTPPRNQIREFARFDNEGFPPGDFPKLRPSYLRGYTRYCFKQTMLVVLKLMHFVRA